jgi:FixJ family two-component response regulator
MGLTLREQEVLSALARGRRYKEIAHELAISLRLFLWCRHAGNVKLHRKTLVQSL